MHTRKSYFDHISQYYRALDISIKFDIGTTTEPRKDALVIRNIYMYIPKTWANTEMDFSEMNM